jgi:hypothetical protein
MRPDGDFDYAQARILARHGMRPRAADWALLAVSRDLRHLLAATARSPMATWTVTLSADMDAHTIERHLRVAWRSYVEQVAGWLPGAWRQAVLWCRWLPELQYVERLARAAAVPAWMFGDPVYGPIAPGPPAERAAAMASGPLAPLAPAVLGTEDAAAAWRRHWRSILPGRRQGGDVIARLEHVAAAFVTEARQSPEEQVRALERFSQRAATVMRRSADSAAGALGHLATVAVDCARLRGLLVERAVFAGGTEAG